MVIGVPKEIKSEENRVAIVPEGIRALVGKGHNVIIETGAGSESGFDDAHYRMAGAQVVAGGRAVFERAEMIMKVKEPQHEEIPLLRRGQILFTFLHLAASRELTEGLLKAGVVAIAYETIEDERGSLPLLAPMSEIAGLMAPQEGAKYLERTYGGRGILLSGTDGVPPADVLVLGAGRVGTSAARIALGMGARVSILDINQEKLQRVKERFGDVIRVIVSGKDALIESLKEADIVIGAVLVTGGTAPKLITRDMLRQMRRGAVLVDVAIDQGGCAETSHPTTHRDPIYIEEGVVHYTVANIPGAVPRTATLALAHHTLPYTIEIADKGWMAAARTNKGLAKGINLVKGFVTYGAVAEGLNLPYRPVEQFL